jgi:cytochrome c oxidase subunit 2
MMEHIITEASSYAGRVDHLIDFIAVVVGVWFFVAQYIFFSFIIKYNRKRHPKAAYITGETKEDGKWVHRAHYSVIFCDLFILYFAISAWHHIKQEMPSPESTIRVTGQQWAWKFTDPGQDNQLDTSDDIVTMDELHVKVDTVYQFKLEAKDVLHSFSVPVFRLKQDAIPGRVITGWFKPTKVGAYDIQCTQMCGIGHGLMGARIFVETAEQHAAWLLKNSPIKPAAAITNDVKNLANNK